MVGTTYFWQGSANSSPNDGDNWLDPLGPSTGTAPADGDSIVFDSTSDGNNDCQFDSANFPASGELVDVTISANFTKFLTTSTTTSINLDGKLEINVGGKIKPTHSMTFDFNTAGSTTVYDGNGDSYTHKPLVIYNVADSMFNSESARALVTFNFGALNLSMIDGIYPNITFTGTIYAKSIYSDTSRTLHNTYGSVDILTVNGGNIDSEKYNIYDYDKQFLFEKGFTSIGEYFRFGHTTARFVTYRSAGTGEVVFPVTGELNSAAFGNDTTKNFYTQYHKIIIENNDNSANYWLLKGGNVLECNEIVVGDGGRFYGPVSGTAAAVIRSVKRPNVYGDWNFREVTDGIYESITGTNVTPVSHGGTGRQTLEKNAVLYGDGMNDIGQLSLGSAGDVLAVNSGGTGIEWSSTGGTNISIGELEDVTITSAAEQEILRYDATAGEWVNETHDRQFIRVKAAEALSKGDVVFIFAVHNANVVKVKKARADSTSTMPAIGIMYETLALDAEGLAVVFGKANGIAANYTEGEIMYVSPTTAGALTNVKPEDASHLIQNVGILMQAHASNATVKVTGVGRTNDTPNTALHPCFFERSSIGTSAVDFRSPTVQSSTANPNAFPMPFGGRVAAATFLFAGGTITGTATNTIRIRKNGGATTKDFTFTPSDLVNTNGNNYTLTKTGSDVDFDFNAGDIIQVRRESGTTNLNNGQAILWVKFNNG